MDFSSICRTHVNFEHGEHLTIACGSLGLSGQPPSLPGELQKNEKLCNLIFFPLLE